VLPVYGQSLVLQEKVDELFEIERVADTFTTASQFEWALLKGQGHLLRGSGILPDASLNGRRQFAPTMYVQTTRSPPSI